MISERQHFSYRFITQKRFRNRRDLTGQKIGIWPSAAPLNRYFSRSQAWNIARQWVMTIFPAGRFGGADRRAFREAIYGTMLSYPDIMRRCGWA